MIPTTKAPMTNAVITQYSIAMARCFQRGSLDSCVLMGANMQIIAHLWMGWAKVFRARTYPKAFWKSPWRTVSERLPRSPYPA